MALIKIGKIVNTHGIKGELRIISDFNEKDQVFVADNEIYINNQPYLINSYRPHKQFDMITLVGFNDINQVLPFKGKWLYFDKDHFKKPILTDLVGYQVFQNNQLIGSVCSILKNNQQTWLVVKTDYKEIKLPYVDAFIQGIDYANQRINILEWEGLL